MANKPTQQHQAAPSLETMLAQADAVFIADLHLSESIPQLTTAFTQLLNMLSRHAPASLYILGDWFDSWIGDDYVDDPDAAWVQQLCTALHQLSLGGTAIYVCHGNRDFALGQAFLDRFAGTLLGDITQITHAGKRYRLEHGDRLCTDDTTYQWFRRIIRSPLVKWLLLRKPLHKRKAIAAKLRQKSRETTANKANDIMDVNQDAVIQALKHQHALIHGHTHRPDTHQLDNGKTRYVLGDWRYTQFTVTAEIGILDADGFALVPVSFEIADAS